MAAGDRKFLKMGQDDLKSGLDNLVDFPEDEFIIGYGEEVFYPEPNNDDVADSNINEIIKSAFTHSEYVGWLKGNILEHRLLAGKNGSYAAGMAQADKYQYYYDEYVRENTPK